ncbi:aldo/keto reductase [Methylocystis heyeri]|uniref:Aldo/keto reductase n=1 Tax=Methylocystis heyeri TaxID=391905 RepID=A0A6B8KF73_9HYPH|nr:aldo/keto reductase [Methylocystis heyeri]QGM45123.1 aldo/keto reductase [Methylocystis heyeri]
MKLRRLGKNGPELPALGLGCMGMSPLRPQPGRHDAAKDAESVATIQAALDAGVRLVNTGDFYGMGHNELLLREALRGRRDKAFLSVKFGMMVAPGGQPLGVDVSPRAVKNFCSYSLQRLDVEAIDLYQPGRIPASAPIEETVGAIAELIKEGKVRHLGLSEVTGAQLRRAHAVHPVTAVEIEYSLAGRAIERDLLPVARELGVGIVAYSVAAQGLLTGAIKGPLPAHDVRNWTPRFHGEALTKNLEVVAKFAAFAASKGWTPTQLAAAWVLAQGEDIVALVGMSNRNRIAENIAAGAIELSADDLAALDRMFAPGAVVGDRYAPQILQMWRS